MKKFKILIVSLSLFSFFLSGSEPDLNSRLAGLARVWGFLKYHHPEVNKGDIDWDAELLAIIPDVKAADSFDGYNAAIDRLIDRAGGVRFFTPDPADIPGQELDADFLWLADGSLFDWYNSQRLKMLKRPGFPHGNHRWVQADPSAGNAVFGNELKYDSPAFPDEGHRLLALFRYWNIIQYYYPYKDEIGGDWQEVLTEFIPRLIAVNGELPYGLRIKELANRINDSHSSSSSPILSEFFGIYYPPFEVRCIEDQTVVTEVFDDLPGVAGSVMSGDVIAKLNGVDVRQRRRELRPYVPASNEVTAERNIHSLLFRGEDKPFVITLNRNGQELAVTLKRFPYETIQSEQDKRRPEKWTILPNNIGYIHMGVLQVQDVDSAMKALWGTKAIIFDVRAYPNGTLYAIQYKLNPAGIPFVSFTKPDLWNPGSFLPGGTLFIGADNPDFYPGPVIVLLDERTQSHGEFTCMSLKTAPRATLIGSQTAGADGNVSYVYLPGNIKVYFTGIGILYPDGSPTQRIGIVPDVEVRPTVAGIRQGRDEVLEAAVNFIDK